MCAMSSKNACQEVGLSKIKDEPEDIEVADVKAEPADEEDSGNNNTAPTLTALLNQPTVAPDRPTNGKESYMKLLNLKLAELAPVPLDVVKVKVDLDGDFNFELSIDEGSNGEKEADDEGEVEDAGLADKNSEQPSSKGGRAKRKLTSAVRDPQADKATEVVKLAQEKLGSSDEGGLEIPVESVEEPKRRPKPNLLKDKEEQNEESDTRKYTCLRCGFITAVDDELRSHMLRKHENELGVEAPRTIRKKMGTKYYPCDKCDQVFSTPRLLQYHRTHHAKVKFYSCGKCDQAFATFDILQKHQFEDQGGCLNAYRFTSGGADEQKSEKDKKATLSTETSECNEWRICQYFLSCGFKTKDQEELIDHMKSHSGSGNQPFSCDKCDYKDYQYGNIVAHRKQHLAPGVTTKVVCKTVWIPPEATSDQLIPETDDLSRSSDSSSVEPPPPPNKSKKSQSDNLSTNTDASPLEPPPAKMKKPQSAEKSFSCDHEGCDYVTGKLYQLQRHQRSHTGEKPYSCMRCDSVAFKGADGLRRHMRKHEDEDGYKLNYAASRGLKSLEIEETDPLAGPPVPIPPERQALVDTEKKSESGKVSSAVSSTEEKSLDTGMSFPCEDCQAVFPSYNSLKNHGIVKHGVKLQLSCTKCRYKTKDGVLLKRHYLKRHASSAISKNLSSKAKAASLVRMVSAGNKVACDSTTLDVDELKT